MVDTQLKDATYLLECRELETYGDSNQYYKVHPFATENINGYYSQLDLNNKDILTVCSSGDHYFNAILHGAKSINCFDINSYTFYYALLKKAIIEVFDNNDFMQCFRNFNRGFWWSNGEFQNIYESVSHKIDSRASTFWKLVYDRLIVNDNQFDKSLFNKFFRGTIELSGNHLEIHNTYFNKYKYELLREKISNFDINFTRCNLLDLPSLLDKKYDMIFLSNISSYLSCMFKNEYLENYRHFIINDLSKLLNVGGIIAFAYIYKFYDTEKYTNNEINNYDVRQNVFGSMSESITFPGLNNQDESGVLLYKKAV